jgi:hypothetical protein
MMKLDIAVKGIYLEPGYLSWYSNGYTLENQRFGVQFPAGARRVFSLLHTVQNGSRVHPASYPVGTGSSLSGGKAGGP